MKYRIIHDGQNIASILEIVEGSAQSTTIYPSYLKLIEEDEKNVKTALAALAVNPDKFDLHLGREKPPISNLLEVAISNYPLENAISRVIQVASELDNKEANEYHFNLRIKHYQDGQHLEEEDKTLKLLADNTTRIPIDNEGNTIGEYDYLKMVTEDLGVDPTAVKIQTIQAEDKKPIEENRFNKVYKK